MFFLFMIKFCIKYYEKGEKEAVQFLSQRQKFVSWKKPVPLGSREIVLNLCFH